MLAMSTFNSFDLVRPLKIWDGAVARAIQGDRMTMAVVDLQPNVAVPEHRHENEQLGFVLSGEITMTVEGQSQTCRAGDTYTIPGGSPHQAVSGPEGCSVVDVFAPIRSDWEQAERLEPYPGGWPGR
jgi:quercetin dioxygenase-like cupin family protein